MVANKPIHFLQKTATACLAEQPVISETVYESHNARRTAHPALHFDHLSVRSIALTAIPAFQGVISGVAIRGVKI